MKSCIVLFSIFCVSCFVVCFNAPIVGAADSDVRQGPVPVNAGSAGVGRMIPDLNLTTIDGRQLRLSQLTDADAIVIAMTGTGCPLCLKYAPTLAAIESEYRDRGVDFVFVNPNESEQMDRLRAAVQTHGLEGPYVRDDDRSISQTLKAKSTTEVFVLDRSRTLVYRGAVDDQYGFGYTLENPRRTFLKDALEATLNGQAPVHAAMTAPGCELIIRANSEVAKPAEVTYHRQIARIINRNCVECHRETGLAPIPLETYEQVRDYAGMIDSVVDRGVMPPWFAAPIAGDKAESGAELHWANERSLSDAEKADIVAWIDAETPEGDPSDAPLPRQFPDGWLIGKPDAVYEFAEPVPVKATGFMPYQNITVETNLEEGKWVRAIEVQPGNRSVVHHVIVSLKSGGPDERDGYWGIYVPGNSTLDYPEGYAKWLPAGATLRFQMHYTPNGTATEDSTRIGLVFAEEPPKHEVKVHAIVDPRFKIPAGANNHEVSAKLDVPADVEVLGFLPHMHLRGKAAKYELVRDGETETLLDVPHYDFNWQLLYRLAAPRQLKSGDTIRYTSWYDNSADNPANPDPTRDVRWGEQTYDEMHLGYVEYVVTAETPEVKPVSNENNDRAKLFRLLDVNKDGAITRDEVRRRMPGDESAATTKFDRLDRDKNDKIDAEELSRL